MELPDILKAAVERKASDVLLVPNQPPMIKFSDSLTFLQGFAMLDSQEVSRVILSSLFDEQRRILHEQLELNCSFTVPQLARFRMSVATQQSGLHAVIRVIPSAIPSAEELDLPESVSNLSLLPRGLVLVTGPAGSGKSTTLACLIDRINQKRSAHIVTIEDPIEFFYTPKNSVICQRELGLHTKSYATALKSVLRQDADVVLIGEIRDKETAEAAFYLAESGPLVFSTLHTTDSTKTIERIVNFFPVEEHRQIQLQIAANLKAAVSQILLPQADGKGLVAAREILIMNPVIESAVREGKTAQIYSAIESGVKLGMISMDKSIIKLVKKNLVTPQVALEKCHNHDTLQAAFATLSRS